MKTLLAMLLAVTGFSVHADSTDKLAELNSAVEQLIAPLRNQTTEARLTFKSIELNDERAIALTLDGHFKKTGPANFAELRIDDLSYRYGDGSAPTTHIKGFVGTDFSKLIPQEQLNKMIPQLEGIVQSVASQFTTEYGAAATVSVEVLGKEQDAAGNYVGLTARLNATVDMSLLPQSVKPEDVFVKSASAEVVAHVNRGLGLDIVVVSNPLYKGFAKDNQGLKETLEKLLNRDPKQMDQIHRFFFDLNEVAQRIANGQGF